MDFETELKMGFLEEAEQAVNDVEQSFLALETNPADTENINKIFRLAHNLKGSSKAVGFDEFGAFTHEFESFILKVKNGELQATSSIVSLLLDANDHIRFMIETLKGDPNAHIDSKILIDKFTNYYEQENPVQISKQADVIATDNMEVEPIDTTQQIENVSTTWDVGHEISFETVDFDHAVPATPTAVPKNPTPPPTAAPPRPAQNAPEESLRVGLSKVETLTNFVGEMTILLSVMKEQAVETKSPLLRKTIHQLGKVGKEIQDLTLGLRMVPIKPTFQKMQRIVRDTSKSLNKEVVIHFEGEETELDKTVLEKINDPLVHLIRNSVDHGIESSENRINIGKDPKGNVRLKACHQAGRLVLEIADDGGGIDTQKLKAKAVEKGILKPNTELSEKEAFNLIFAPGFSTKEQITDVSGRGVGMDVVRTNITELGGEIQIESILGQGTRFRIILPLTLAIVDAMVLCYSKHRFVIPLNHIHETLRIENGMIQHNTNMGNTLLLRGENIPLFRLGDYFAIKSQTPIEKMIIIVIKSTQQPVALAIDDILGQLQIVIKQLSPELQNLQGISGTTILGDGKPALILEPQDLIKRKISLSYVPSSVPTEGKIA